MHTKIIAAVAATAFISAPLHAQSWTSSAGMDRAESRMQVGLTIPLGGKGKEKKPRLELAMVQDRISHNGERKSWRYKAPSKGSIGFTLDQKPTLMLNGRQYFSPKDQKNVSTGAAIAIGVGVVLIGAIAIAAANNANDLSFNRND